MWLIIKNSNSRIEGIANDKPPDGAWDTEIFSIKEWYGPARLGGLDPTGGSMGGYINEYSSDFELFASMLDGEIAWIDGAIPNIETMDSPTFRYTMRRMAENLRRVMAACRYVSMRVERIDQVTQS